MTSSTAMFARPMAHWLVLSCGGIALLGACNAVRPGAVVTGQPESGPGGADYTHASVVVQRHGEGRDEYWLFLPDHPMPEQAPVVMFLHGWTAMDPQPYGAWIRHMTRKGHIVVYPRYQASLLDDPETMLNAAAGAVQGAWLQLQTGSPVKPRADKIVWIGHSLGATFSALLAPRSQELGLPPAESLLLVQPGGETRIPLDAIAGLPLSTRVTLVVGDEDTVVANDGAAAIVAQLAHMPPANVEHVLMRSDRRVAPALPANHLAPLAVTPGFPPTLDRPRRWLRDSAQGRFALRHAPDALDWYGFWKLADGMLDAAFRGRNASYAFGDTQQQRFMGVRADGTPIEPLQVTRPLDEE